MTANHFFSWLQRFNEYISRDPNRKVVLCANNCAAHESVDILPILSNIIVKLLTSNKTSKMQPCDAGIIEAMKVRYRMFHMERAIDLIEMSTKQVYHVDILSAMLAFKIIRNLFKNQLSRTVGIRLESLYGKTLIWMIQLQMMVRFRKYERKSKLTSPNLIQPASVSLRIIY